MRSTQRHALWRILSKPLALLGASQNNVDLLDEQWKCELQPVCVPLLTEVRPMTCTPWSAFQNTYTLPIQFWHKGDCYITLPWNEQKINSSLAIDFCNLILFSVSSFLLHRIISLPPLRPSKKGWSQVQGILKFTCKFRVSISLGLRESWC